MKKIKAGELSLPIAMLALLESIAVRIFRLDYLNWTALYLSENYPFNERLDEWKAVLEAAHHEACLGRSQVRTIQEMAKSKPYSELVELMRQMGAEDMEPEGTGGGGVSPLVVPVTDDPLEVHRFCERLAKITVDFGECPPVK